MGAVAFALTGIALAAGFGPTGCAGGVGATLGAVSLTVATPWQALWGRAGQPPRENEGVADLRGACRAPCLRPGEGHLTPSDLEFSPEFFDACTYGRAHTRTRTHRSGMGPEGFLWLPIGQLWLGINSSLPLDATRSAREPPAPGHRHRGGSRRPAGDDPDAARAALPTPLLPAGSRFFFRPSHWFSFEFWVSSAACGFAIGKLLQSIA